MYVIIPVPSYKRKRGFVIRKVDSAAGMSMVVSIIGYLDPFTSVPFAATDSELASSFWTQVAEKPSSDLVSNIKELIKLQNSPVNTYNNSILRSLSQRLDSLSKSKDSVVTTEQQEKASEQATPAGTAPHIPSTTLNKATVDSMRVKLAQVVDSLAGALQVESIMFSSLMFSSHVESKHMSQTGLQITQHPLYKLFNQFKMKTPATTDNYGLYELKASMMKSLIPKAVSYVSNSATSLTPGVKHTPISGRKDVPSSFANLLHWLDWPRLTEFLLSDESLQKVNEGEANESFMNPVSRLLNYRNVMRYYCIQPTLMMAGVFMSGLQLNDIMHVLTTQFDWSSFESTHLNPVKEFRVHPLVADYIRAHSPKSDGRTEWGVLPVWHYPASYPSLGKVYSSSGHIVKLIQKIHRWTNTAWYQDGLRYAEKAGWPTLGELRFDPSFDFEVHYPSVVASDGQFSDQQVHPMAWPYRFAVRGFDGQDFASPTEMAATNMTKIKSCVLTNDFNVEAGHELYDAVGRRPYIQLISELLPTERTGIAGIRNPRAWLPDVAQQGDDAIVPLPLPPIADDASEEDRYARLKRIFGQDTEEAFLKHLLYAETYIFRASRTADAFDHRLRFVDMPIQLPEYDDDSWAEFDELYDVYTNDLDPVGTAAVKPFALQSSSQPFLSQDMGSYWREAVSNYHSWK